MNIRVAKLLYSKVILQIRKVIFQIAKFIAKSYLTMSWNEPTNTQRRQKAWE